MKEQENNISPVFQFFSNPKTLATIGALSFLLAQCSLSVRPNNIQILQFFTKQIPMRANYLRQFLNRNILEFNINSARISTIPDGQLINGQGIVSPQLLNNKILMDPMFGVIASSYNILGLKRMIHIYKKNKNLNFTWIKSEDFKKNSPQAYHPCMQSVTFYPEWMLNNQLKLSENLQKSFLQNYKYDYSFKFHINSELINNYFQKLNDTHSNLKCNPYHEQKELQNQNDIEINSDKQFQNHPFTYAFEHNRKIKIDSEYIYIVRDSEQLTEGDIRISFQEIKPFLKASVIAQKQGNSLVDCTVDYFEGNTINTEINLKGKYQKYELKDCCTIKEGKFDKKQLIEAFLKQLNLRKIRVPLDFFDKENEGNHNDLFKVLSCFLFLAYLILASQLELNALPWSIGLTTSHILSTLFYSFGIINTSAFIGLIGVAYSISKITSVIQIEEKNKIQQLQKTKSQQINLYQNEDIKSQIEYNQQNKMMVKDKQDDEVISPKKKQLINLDELRFIVMLENGFKV